MQHAQIPMPLHIWHLLLGRLVRSQSKQSSKRQKSMPTSELAATLCPCAIETSGVFGSEALSLLEDIGRQIRAETGEPRFFQFLLQGVSVAIQRGNAASVLGTAHLIDNVFI